MTGLKPLIVVTTGSALILSLYLIGGLLFSPPPADAPSTPTPADTLRDNRAATEAFYRTRIPAERAQAGWQDPPAGLPDLRASTCGECHTEIYAEWQRSTHGQAWTDAQFVKERAKSGNRWMCAGCHTPLLNQMAQWPVSLIDGDVERPRYVKNPTFEQAFQDEGITCAACHARGGVIEGPTGIKTDAHPTRKAERFLNETLCTQCHQAIQEYPGKTFTCTFNTGKEWAAGPYGRAGFPCQGCHMQPVERAHAKGAAPRPGRRHFWPGAGIYKRTNFGPPLDQLTQGLGVAVEGKAELLSITLTNARAGHMLPTGDPERFIMVRIKQLDAGGRVVSRLEERIGQTWKWWPKPEKLGDNRLAPQTSRTLNMPWADGAVRWELTASSHRISEESAQYHTLSDYPTSRVTHTLSGARTAH